MLTDATLNDLDHIARMMREATEMDAVDRAVCNYAAHDLATRIEQRHTNSVTADCADVDSLTAELDATRVQLGTVRAQLDDVVAATANDATLAQRYNAGYAAGLADDPAPIGSADEVYMRGFKHGQVEVEAVELRVDRDQLRNRVADLEAALESARNGSATIIYASSVAHGLNGDAPTNVTTVKSPESLTVPPTPPSEVVSHRGEQPSRKQRIARPETGFRYKGTNAQLLEQTVAAIRTLATELGRSPTSTDWSERCGSFGLPTLETLRSRLDKTWLQLVLAADLAPAPSDGRRSYRDAPVTVEVE